MAERLALRTLDQRVSGSNPTGREFLSEPKRHFIAQSPSYSTFYWVPFLDHSSDKWATQSDQSSLSVWRKLGSLATHWTLRCPGWPEFAGRTCHFVDFVMMRLKWVLHLGYPGPWLPVLSYYEIIFFMDQKWLNATKTGCRTPPFLVHICMWPNLICCKKDTKDLWI